MKTVIGVITTQPYKVYLEQLEEIFRDRCQLIFFVPESLQEVDTLYEQNKNKVDGFVFSGLFIYESIKKEHLSSQVPFKVLHDDEGTIFKSLFKILLNNPGINTKRIFIDFAYRIESLAEYSDRFCAPVHPVDLTGSIHEQTEQLLKNHIELWESGQIDLAITAFGFFVPELTARGVKFLFIPSSPERIQHLMLSLLDEVTIQKLNNRKMVVGRISVEQETVQNGYSGESSEDITVLKRKLKDFLKMNKLIDTSQQFPDFIQLDLSYEAYLGISEGLQGCMLLNYLQQWTDKSVKIGWGAGRQYFQARENAEKANRQAAAYKGSCSFFISEDQKVTGPLDRSGAITFKEMADDEVLETADKLGIHNINLQKIIAYAGMLGTNKLSSEDVAQCLSITVRGANRILNQIESKAFAGIVHEKRENTKGRPKKYYEMTFLDERGNFIT